MLFYKLGYITYFPTIAFFWFYIKLPVYDHYYIIPTYILLYHSYSIPPVPSLILSHHEYSLLDITCFISICFCMLVPTT